MKKEIQFQCRHLFGLQKCFMLASFYGFFDIMMCMQHGLSSFSLGKREREFMNIASNISCHAIKRIMRSMLNARKGIVPIKQHKKIVANDCPFAASPRPMTFCSFHTHTHSYILQLTMKCKLLACKLSARAQNKKENYATTWELYAVFGLHIFYVIPTPSA